MTTLRHLTATGFVVHADRILLHWHRKNAMWLPFGGHLEENEDPVQTVLREVEEECGLRTEILCPTPTFGVRNLPVVAPPVLILIEPTTDGVTRHEHIDLIYFCRPIGGIEALATTADPTIRWLGETELRENRAVAPLDDVPPALVPEDVRVLGLAAIEQARSLRGEHPQYP